MTFERALLAVAILAAVLVAWKLGGWLLRRRALSRPLDPPGVSTILYFTTDDCVQCRFRQKPELRTLLARRPDVVIRQLDAVAERDLASRFHVLTVPSTVVVAADGAVRAVNYGLASADRLARQLG